MNDFPNFSQHGYQVTRELGYNSLGGRVTYLATKINTNKSVVIKQFQFAQLGASWTEYDAYEQEIKVLESLDFPGIPRYLDAFGTDSGFCMVQEYKNAESAIARNFSPPDIKQIAIATLEILAYLQSQKPPVIHRDIKPENLLIDDELNVYLVDFGFARLGGGNIAASSVVKGTMGFMPPEQMFNRQLTEASDLYGLGATLICLLTGTKSGDVGNLIDDNYSIHFRHLVPPLQQGWMNWLETMVAPRIQDRYKSAADALTALRSLDASSLPKVRLERDRIQFTATEYGEILTQTIAISNPIPDTMLCGRWEVAPHPNDPPHTPYDHSWISFEPQAFESNNIECTIAVDTSKLLESQTYNRQIILRANSEPETHTIELQATTAPLPVPQKTNFLSVFRLIFMFCLILASFMCCLLLTVFIFYWIDYQFVPPEVDIFLYSGTTTILLPICFTSGLLGFLVAEIAITAQSNKYDFNWFLALCGGLIGLIFSGFISSILTSLLVDIAKGTIDYQLINFVYAGSGLVSIPVTLLAALILGRRITNLMIENVTVAVIMLLLSFSLYTQTVRFVLILALASLIYKIVYSVFNKLIDQQIAKQIIEVDATKRAFLTAGFCMSLSVAFLLFIRLDFSLKGVETIEILVVGGTIITSLAVTGIPLIDSLVFKPKRMLANYRKSRPNLIKL
ncbi:MAG: protein kinase [Microcoleus sp. PH2017_10_PVI_O_A]|uniref:serine/threonine protein kinase n=1 Tax=unclassified Microcoleus TaxID=2642155 RepID=UPI001DBFE5F0|nr:MULTISPECIES: serine/threonine-protein kinase [unclassified Microcoleus]TAE82449.1 MAG: serine/threonine protein kinase [Oscillatoriales cyanobacterium]MCC3406195.1 protein kinase [Microcoleus sp. PH2017_10_PVI_O_A]MCC3460786.1 protein kinase [Microcoleus sp. PH2017_11_PCY_U_A]MCC3479349.1 protein kinase [Microcoleus sp. PH2017_12_PCY_D_A]MCC3560190.1 protein kinase [Microcoleus sp. PH2017_27_LUM_O_A]